MISVKSTTLWVSEQEMNITSEHYEAHIEQNFGRLSFAYVLRKSSDASQTKTKNTNTQILNVRDLKVTMRRTCSEWNYLYLLWDQLNPNLSICDKDP